MNTQEQNAEQGKEAKKVLAGFNETVKKLTAIVKGPENLKITGKVKKDAMQELVEELFKEESDATVKQVKEELKNLLKGYVTLNNSLTEERKKLDALEVAKKKEFNQTAAKLFAKIEGVDSLTKEYFGAFQEASKVVTDHSDEDKEISKE